MKISKRIVLSSLVCVLPLIVSALLYGQLPDPMPVHWNSTGEANGFVAKNIGAWGLPLLMLAVHLVVSVKTENGKFDQPLSPVTGTLCYWAVPLLSVVLVPVSLFKAAGYRLDIAAAVLSVVGVLFIAAGNYLPKNRPNGIAGYKLPWTRTDPDNWNKTHRFAGAVWVICGFVFLIVSFLSHDTSLPVFAVLAALLALLSPVLYSCLLSRKSA